MKKNEKEKTKTKTNTNMPTTYNRYANNPLENDVQRRPHSKQVSTFLS